MRALSRGLVVSATALSLAASAQALPVHVQRTVAIRQSVHVTFRAGDGFSPLKRAEYSVDAGDWKYVEPVGQLSDAKNETYDFKFTLEPAKDGAPTSDHVVVVRVYDRYENMGAAKTLIRAK